MSRSRSSRRFQKRHISDALGLETVINPHKRQQPRKGYHLQEIPIFVDENGDVVKNQFKAYKVLDVWKHADRHQYVGSKFILHEK